MTTRKVVTFVILTGAAVAAAGPIAGLAAEGGSPMFRGGPEHTGVYAGAGVASLHGVKWVFPTGGAIYGLPAVVDGVAYIGSNDGVLYAVEASSGSLKWKLPTKGRIASSPAVAGGLVIVLSYDSKLYAVDAATGQTRWTFATGGEHRFAARHIHGIEPAADLMPDPFDFYLSSPAVANNRVYFGSGDGHVYALDVATGAVVWKFATGNVVHASPAVANGVVYVGSWDTYFYALDAATGAERWKFKTGEDEAIHNQTGIQSSAAVADGVAYFGCRDGKLYALDAAGGQLRWVFDNKGSWVIGSPAVHQGVVYFATSDSALFHAVDAKTGADRFSLSLKWPMFSSPAVAGPFVYLGSHEGKLTAIDSRSGQVAWIYQTDASRERGPALTTPEGGPNYRAVRTTPFYDDVVASIQRMFEVGAMLSSPAVVGDVIYVGSADGHLYAIH